MAPRGLTVLLEDRPGPRVWHGVKPTMVVKKRLGEMWGGREEGSREQREEKEAGTGKQAEGCRDHQDGRWV